MANSTTHSEDISRLKRAFHAIEKLQSRLNAIEYAKTEPIAIIGIGCRFPGGADTPESFWQLLHDGVDAITEVLPDRWDIEEYYDPNPDAPGKMYTRYGGFLKHVDTFDPLFFGISPREAILLDPQQRVLLEVGWEALENANQVSDQLFNSLTGVFIGISNNDYLIRFMEFPNHQNQIDPYMGTGNAFSAAGGRLSYTLGLTGPCMAIDTACSSSLVTVHLACQSLRNRECDLALAGGVNLILTPEPSINFSKARMLAPDGRCKTFDATANGYVRGEGCGVIVLKRLSDAVANNDNILALIRGSRVNQDGPSGGLTVPNGPSQEEVIRQALAIASVEPEQVSYIEAHGTGTSLGDPIELGALAEVFGKDRSQDNPLIIGSVKTNIGHLEAAAGIAGLIKVVLALQHMEIPPHLHFKKPNPHFSWNKFPFVIPTESRQWHSGEQRQIAGVSSFGFSGTNAHVIIEEAPDSKLETRNLKLEKERPLHLLTLSAKTKEALKELTDRYKNHLTAYPDLAIEDICFTANICRSFFNHRLSVTASSSDELGENLSAFTTGQTVKGVVQGKVISADQPKIVFLFTGQGSQYIGMGRELYETQPTFHQTLDHCDEILHPYLEIPLLAILYPDLDKSKIKNLKSKINMTAYTQPALFAIEYALAELWKSWGIRPAAVMGHSIGEYVAACIAGVFSLEDGLKLIAERARLMQALPQDGQMVAVFAHETMVSDAIQSSTQNVSIAAVNGPQIVVISGKHEAVEAITVKLKAEGIKTKPLNVSHAFHSPLMEPILEEFERIARKVAFSSPQIALISNVSGQLAKDEVTTPEYWRRHIRQPVRFAAGIETLYKQGYEVFLEIGPKPILLGLGRQIIANSKSKIQNPKSKMFLLPSLRQGRSDWQQLLQSLGELHVHGIHVDWAGFERDYPRRRVALPTYPFQRQRYWIESSEKVIPQFRGSVRKGKSHPLLGQRLFSAALQYKEIQFESQISQNLPAFLKDHCVFQKVILPTAAYLEMALAAGNTVCNSSNLVIEEFVIRQPLILEEDETKIIQLILIPEGDSSARVSLNSPKEYSFQIFSLTTHEEDEDPSWILHVSGKLFEGEKDSVPPQTDLTTLQTQCTEEISPETFYQEFRERGINYEYYFQGIKQLYKDQGQALGRIQLPKELVFESEKYNLHPALMDAAMQVIGATLSINTDEHDSYLPVSIMRLRFYRSPGASVWSHAQISPFEDSTQETFMAKELCLFTSDGQIVAIMEGLLIKKASRKTLLSIREAWQDWLYKVEWLPRMRLEQQPPVDYLPAPGEIKERINSQLAQLISHLDLESYQEALTRLEALSIDYVLHAFQRMGYTFQPSSLFSTADIAEQLGVVNQYQRLLGRLLEMLAEEGWLKRTDEQWEVILAPKIQESQEQTKTLLAQYPIAEAELTLLERCGAKLPQILRGEYDPLQLIFPEGDLSTATMLYQDSPGAQVMNTLVRQAIVSALEHVPHERVVRILEIGSGTGGTTSYILSCLPTEQIEYTFTDISPLFTTQAQEKFREYPFMRYQILDIEQNPESQNFGDHQYDIIVAANVLHTTRDLRQTLQHVRQLLAPKGMLVLLEGTVPLRWLDLIFGLTEGWWRFTDHDLRPAYPLLSAFQWQQLLRENGFQQAESIAPDQKEEERVSQQAVIVAQATQAVPEVKSSQPRNWLILADNQGIGQQLAALLQKKNEICTLVFPGNEYERVADREFRIDPGNSSGFQQLINQITGTDKPPLYRVVNLWSLDASENQDLTIEDLDMALKKGCGITLHLIQTLAKAEFSEPPSLWLVTRNAQPVKKDPSLCPSQEGGTPIYFPQEKETPLSPPQGEEISPSPPRGGDSIPLTVAQSPLWGMGRVIALEHPELWGGMIDLAPETVDNNAATLLAEIWKPQDEDHIVFRGGQRYVARLMRSHQPESQSIQFQSDNTYLITGGLGFLGLKLARWMIEQGARHLVLTGRSGLPERDSWTDLPENTDTWERVEALQALEEMGATVIVLQADVSDHDQMAQVFEQVNTTQSPLKGIIHAAGVAGYQPLQDMALHELSSVLRPKVMGTWVLHQLTKDLNLDFFVCFSSASSVWGARGQGHYAAANHFLDAIAYYRHSLGLPTLSVNWGLFPGTSMVGKEYHEWLEKIGLGEIQPEQGFKLMGHLLAMNEIQITVAKVDWGVFKEIYEARGRHPLLNEIVSQDQTRVSKELSEQSSKILQQLQETPPNERQEILVTHLQAEVARVLGLAPSQFPEPNQGFFDMGMDSLMAIDLKTQLEKGLEASLPSTLMFEYPTIEKLAGYIGANILEWEEPVEVAPNEEIEQKTDQLAAELESLSEAEMAELLAKEIKTMRQRRST